MDKKLYTKDSIESLDPLQFTRLRPQVYAGDCTYSTQLLIEIVSNAVDEYRLGHGEKILVDINKDQITVVDDGQGFIVNSMRDDGKTILEAAFSVLNTSGKFRADGSYEGTSLGSFGIGGKITNFLSHWFSVKTIRDGLFESIDFKEGVFDNRVTGEWVSTDKKSGTIVRWKPSEEFFTHTEVEISKIKSLFKTIVCLCKGLTIELNYNGEKEIFFSKNGIDDLIDEAIEGKEIPINRFHMNFVDGKEKMDAVFAYTTNYSSTIIPYVNTGLTEKGSHITQVKTILTREFNKFFREKKWLKDKDENLTGDDIQEGLYLVFNITAPEVGYDAQVKSTVTKIDIKSSMQAFSEALQNWLKENEKNVKTIADKALNARKAREAAKKARENIRNQREKKNEVLKYTSKLADAYSTDRSKCEIYIVEGDSASGNLKAARNNEFQAVLPIRGKLLNLKKAKQEKINKNTEIKSIIDSFGLILNPTTGKYIYASDKPRYNKIIIESDADIDGAHIKNLFFTDIWEICPDLILDGHIYAGYPPLYKITLGKDTYIYLKDDEELIKFRQEYEGKKYVVKHLKGLGEMSPEETKILVDPSKRVIKQITVTDIEETEKLFNDLMGDAVLPRKQYIQEHSKEVHYFG